MSRRAARRLVLLGDGEASAVVKVLAEFPGEQARQVHEELQRFACGHPGKIVAAEWQGPDGWTRFLWCRK